MPKGSIRNSGCGGDCEECQCGNRRDCDIEGLKAGLDTI